MNCQPIKYILRYHRIDCYALQKNRKNKKRKVSENVLFKCVTRPDLSGVPLRRQYMATCSVGLHATSCVHGVSK